MPEVRTVRAELEDLDALVALFDGYRRFYRQPSDVVGARAFLADRIKRGESVIFLAVVAGAIADFTQLYPLFSSVSMKRVWLLSDLFVAPDARKSGAGRALLERAERWAAETGAKGLTLSTEVTNRDAQPATLFIRHTVAKGWTLLDKAPGAFEPGFVEIHGNFDRLAPQIHAAPEGQGHQGRDHRVRPAAQGSAAA